MRRYVTLCLVVAAAACASEEAVEGPVTASSITERRAAMLAEVAASMDEPKYFHDGTWHLHYGDGLMFGPSYDLAAWSLGGQARHKERAEKALVFNTERVAAASKDLAGAMKDLEHVAMALLGLLESGQFLDTTTYVEAAEPLLDVVDKFSRSLGDYLEISAGEFAVASYGPTSVSSLIALAHLELALGWPEREGAKHVERAQQVLEHIEAKAWDEGRKIYRFATGDERLMLYPNATLMLAHARAFQLTGEVRHRERVEALYEGIQPLRAATGDHFHSPYSREEADAVDEDYATLSSQNYLSMALWIAWGGTADQRFIDELDRVLGWVEGHLFVDGVLKHHWVNGRVANEEDQYDFCSGCNLQTLYILKIVEAGAGE